MLWPPEAQVRRLYYAYFALLLAWINAFPVPWLASSDGQHLPGTSSPTPTVNQSFPLIFFRYVSHHVGSAWMCLLLVG